jgi:hypothetical protein
VAIAVVPRGLPAESYHRRITQPQNRPAISAGAPDALEVTATPAADTLEATVTPAAGTLTGAATRTAAATRSSEFYIP